MTVTKRTVTEYKIEANATAGDLARALDELPQDAVIISAEVQQQWDTSLCTGAGYLAGYIYLTIETEGE